MTRYRIDIFSNRPDASGAVSFEAPDIPTALVVAEINMSGGSAELWDGERRIADLQRQPGTHSAYWRVS